MVKVADKTISQISGAGVDGQNIRACLEYVWGIKMDSR